MAGEPGRAAVASVRRGLGRQVAAQISAVGILSYHRVAEPAFDPWALSVSPANFADQLRVLGDIGRFVRLEDVVGRKRWRPGRTPRFVVTFDDGYVDNLLAALPVLERYGAPATVFVSTAFLGRAAFWWDVLDEAVLDHTRAVDGLAAAGRSTGLLVHADATATRQEIQAELHASLARRAPSDVEPLVGELLAAADLEPPEPNGRPLTTAQLVELAAHPLVSIGVHTVHHVRLPHAGAALARSELVEARDVLDQLTGPARRAVAYPHGDVDASVAALVHSLDFSCAVTTDHRWTRPRDDRMLLPRLTATDLSGEQLRQQLTAAPR